MLYQRREYYVNGWQEGERYFLSFGFTERELDRMMEGETIHKGENTFRIELIDRY